MARTGPEGPVTTDLAKVRARLRKMSHQSIFAMLDEAVGLLPKAKLDLLVRRYLSPQLMENDGPKSRTKLMVDVTDFVERSRRGDYFEAFDLPFAAVAQALSRGGQIQRLSKGLYHRPRSTAFGVSRPNPAKVTRWTARAT